MIWLELALFLAVCAVGVCAYHVGRKDGYDRGWFDGHQHATWAFLPPSHVAPYDRAD